MLSVLIRWIGWDVELSRSDSEIKNSEDQTIQIKSLGEKKPVDGETEECLCLGQRVKFDRYGLTKDGKAVCVDAYCLSVAEIPQTYVILMQDRD